MKVKATVSFAGTVTMAVNEVRDLPNEVATPLLSCGYLIPADDETDDAPAPERKPRAKKSAKKNEEE